MATIEVAEFWLGSADDEHGKYSHGDIIARGLALEAHVHSDEKLAPLVSGSVKWAGTEASYMLSQELYDEEDRFFPAEIKDQSSRLHKCLMQFIKPSEFTIELYEGPFTSEVDTND